MIDWLFNILFFALPLIFFPKTSEVFEFNKMIAVYVFTTLITAAWIVKMVLHKKILFRKTALTIPLLLFLGSQVLSTIVSIDQHTSIFGYYSRFNGGLLSILCYTLLYFAYVSNMDKNKTKKVVIISLVSALLVAIYGIFEHFGHSISCVFVSGYFDDNCWVQDIRTRVFATFGQPNWLAAYLTSLVPLTWYYALTQKKNNTKIIWMIVSLLFFACILFTKSRSGLLGLVVATGIFGSFNLQKHFKKLIIIGFLFLAAILIFGTPWTPSLQEITKSLPAQARKPQITNQPTENGEGGTDSGAIRKIVWSGAFDIFKHYPIFGTGVETFGYSYWQFRPQAANTTSEWNFLYNKAHNEYLNTLANTGIIGLITYSILIFISLYQILNLRSNSNLKIALAAGYVSILITNFFGFSVVLVSLLTFIFPAIAVSLDVKPIQKRLTSKFDLNQKMFVACVFVVGAFILILIGRYFSADYFYNLGKNDRMKGLYTKSINDLETAISFSPDEAIYHNELSKIFSDVAVGLYNENYLQDAAKIAPFAIAESNLAFKLSSRNMNVRESRISMYLQLGQMDFHYFGNAINLTRETINLSPTDPALELALGKAYLNSGNLTLAKLAFENALKLKPDYAEAQKDLEIVNKLQKK